MPALPLDEAGKYVAAAYLVFLALLLIYVAIMSGRLSRLERDLTELNRELDAADEAKARDPEHVRMSELITMGVSYKTAPVELRERLSLTEARIPEVLQQLQSHPSVQEAVVISTCNRMEVSVVVDEPVAAETAVIGLLTQKGDLRPTELAEVMYAPRNCDAARHLFRVTAGLESMVLGEAEVQGQVKRAYEHALAAGTTGPLTNRLFTAALQAGKRVRTETGDRRGTRIGGLGRRLPRRGRAR